MMRDGGEKWKCDQMSKEKGAEKPLSKPISKRTLSRLSRLRLSLNPRKILGALG